MEVILLKQAKHTRDVFISKLDADVIVSTFSWEVLNSAATISVVPASHLGLRGSLDREAQAALTGTPGLNGKDCGGVGHCALQTYTKQAIKCYHTVSYSRTSGASYSFYNIVR